MSTDYDLMAARYRRAKAQDWRSAVEAHTLMGLLGNIAGLSVIDLACGEGYYTRRLRNQGAQVVGVDLSREMIGLALAAELAHPLGIEYCQGDVREVNLAPEFDLAIAAYLLNYARDRDDLARMCRGVARTLKPGGRFVTVNTNPGHDFKTAPSYLPYGFGVELRGEPIEGTPVVWTFYLEDGPLRVENYYLDTAAHEEALLAAGFGDITWHRPVLSPLVEAAQGGDPWRALLDHPPVILLECRR